MFSLKRHLHKLNWKIIGSIIGYALIIEGCLLFLPVIVDFLYKEGHAAAYLFTIVLCFLFGFALASLKTKHSYFAKDGMFAVGLTWIIISIFGGLPFFFTREIPSFVDCFFETVSGFTTTGSSILTDVEALSHASLFWRSFTHWIGGMGILVFLLAVVPRSNGRMMHIMRAEAPGPVIGKLVPRIRESAAILYKIYLALSALMLLFLLLGGMPLFDALCTTFGTAGTGGFGIKNNSIAFYDSVYLEMVISFFMLLFGINFNLFYFMLIKNAHSVLHNEEVRMYLLVVTFSIVTISLNIQSMMDGSLLLSLRYAIFQVASIISTTGFTTADFSQWPLYSKTILLILMLIGACAGSTAGGLKISRLLILLKQTKLDLQRLIHPQKVDVITMDEKKVDHNIVHQICSYFFCYLLILVIVVLIVSLDNFDLESTIGACFACLGNVGPGLGIAGPLGNFALFSDLSKITLSFAMLIGRLEIYPILIFIAAFFQQDKRKYAMKK